jgi:hypothetical protein
MRHARHEKALSAFERATIAIPAGTKHIVIVYDGPNVPAADRLASFISDAPTGDVALVCKAVADQIDNA